MTIKEFFKIMVKNGKTLSFSNGSYRYTDINKYIRETLIANDDFEGDTTIAP